MRDVFLNTKYKLSTCQTYEKHTKHTITLVKWDLKGIILAPVLILQRSVLFF